MYGLTLITYFSRTIGYDYFEYVDSVQLEDKDGNNRYCLVGIISSEDESYMVLCSEATIPELREQHNKLATALKYGESLVDFRKPQTTPLDGITLLKNTTGKSGSDLN